MNSTTITKIPTCSKSISKRWRRAIAKRGIGKNKLSDVYVEAFIIEILTDLRLGEISYHNSSRHGVEKDHKSLLLIVIMICWHSGLVLGHWSWHGCHGTCTYSTKGSTRTFFGPFMNGQVPKYVHLRILSGEFGSMGIQQETIQMALVSGVIMKLLSRAHSTV